MSNRARSIALAWIAVLAKPALYVQSERMAELHRSAEERPGERGKPDVHEEEQEDHAQEERNTPRKFIAGVPVLHYHEVYGGARERKGVDMASLGEFEGEQKRWLVMLSPDTSDADLGRLCDISPGCNVTEFSINGGLKVVIIIGTEQQVNDMIDQANVTKVGMEPDSVLEPIPDIIEPDQAPPGDVPWGLTRIGGGSARSAHGGRGATVFVIDTGVLVTHTEFNGRATPGLDATQEWPTGLECNGDQACAQDLNGHGTHCAGTAVGQNVGVAPGASVMSIGVFDARGRASSFWLYVALNWLADTQHRPAVGSMSLGGNRTSSTAVEYYVDRAVQRGVTIVVAAGNDAKDSCMTVPAYIESAITVGSTNSLDSRSFFSNYGTCTNIWAPGSFVRSAYLGPTNSVYATLSGTSMACPHVSGVVALIQELNKNATPAEVRDELTKYAEKGKLSFLKVGDVNVLLSAQRLPCSR